MSEKTWFVYMIETSNGKLYTGITLDLERRLKEHQEGKKGAKFFRSTEAKSLQYFEVHPNRSEALKREAQIKKMSRAQKLKILGNLDGREVSS